MRHVVRQLAQRFYTVTETPLLILCYFIWTQVLNVLSVIVFQEKINVVSDEQYINNLFELVTGCDGRPWSGSESRAKRETLSEGQWIYLQGVENTQLYTKSRHCSPVAILPESHTVQMFVNGEKWRLQTLPHRDFQKHTPLKIPGNTNTFRLAGNLRSRRFISSLRLYWRVLTQGSSVGLSSATVLNTAPLTSVIHCSWQRRTSGRCSCL